MILVTIRIAMVAVHVDYEKIGASKQHFPVFTFALTAEKNLIIKLVIAIAKCQRAKILPIRARCSICLETS